MNFNINTLISMAEYIRNFFSNNKLDNFIADLLTFDQSKCCLNAKFYQFLAYP